MDISSIFSSDKEKENDNHAVSPIPERLQKHRNVAIVTGDDVEDTEFFYPYYRLTEEGYKVDVFTEKGGEFKGKHGLGLKDSLPISQANVANYDLVYLPGGKAPSQLRKNETVLNFVRQFVATGKPIAAICHGPQILISANLVRGKEIAAWPEVREELEKAGAIFADEALSIDGQFITARKPGDLHRHLSGTLKALGATGEGKKPADMRPAA